MPNTGEGPLIALRLASVEFEPTWRRGDHLFYRQKPKHKASAYVGEICYVELKEGRRKVARLMHGSRTGRFSLDARGVHLVDVEITFVSPIVFWRSKREAER